MYIVYKYIYIYIHCKNKPAIDDRSVCVSMSLPFQHDASQKSDALRIDATSSSEFAVPSVDDAGLKLNRFDQKNNSSVVEPTPLKNMSSSVGIILPN